MADAGSESDSDEDEVEYTEMQQPTLMKQLQTILSEYPDDGQILKEIIQNAEDAEATELKILYDGRQVNVDPLKTKKRKFKKYFRGPGLVIYNNAEFSNEDWKGITTLYSSNKELDRTKVGKFGLGFKSVFHITDHPIIISGEYLLILDPHQKNPTKVCKKIKLAKVGKCRGMEKSDLLNCLSGIFGFSEKVLDNGYYKGTLFRFSLRDTASELSDNIYDEAKLSDLINSFKTEAPVTLLFLKSMEKIEIFAKNSAQFPDLPGNQPVFIVKIDGENLIEARTERKNFLKKIKAFKKEIPEESISNEYEVTIRTRCHERDSCSEAETVWFVYNLLKGKKISDNMRRLSEDEGLGYSPYVGMAYPLFPVSGTDFKGHIFCFLPLPLEQKSLTGLPVHVNGFFALSQNRRCVKWATADQINNHSHKDKAIQWNEGLISEMLPEIYVDTINHLINKSLMNQNPDNLVSMVTRCIPNIDAVDDKWQSLTKALFASLLNQAFLFTRNNGGRWIRADEAVFTECRKFDNSKISDSDIEKTLLKLVNKYGQNLVEVPPHIKRMIETQMSSPQFITPNFICQLMKRSELYTSLNSKEKIQVLHFILESGHYKELNGLNLLPLNSGDFTQFIPRQTSCSSKVYYCRSSDDVKMFPGIKQHFVTDKLSQEIHCHFKEIAREGMYQIFQFSQSDFKAVISQSINAQFPSNTLPITNPSTVEKWLQIVWTYLRQNFHLLDGQFNDIRLLPAFLFPDNEFFLNELSGLYILKSFNGMDDLPLDVCICLRNLSITVLQSVPEYVTDHPAVMKNLVHYPNSDSVLKLLLKLSESGDVSSIVSTFNEKSTEENKNFFSLYIQKYILSDQSKIPISRAKFILSQMNLFDGSRSTKKVSLNRVRWIAPVKEIPVPYPKELLLCKDQREREFAKLLEAEEITLSSLICEILEQLSVTRQTVYSSQEKQNVMSFVKENLQTDNEVIQKAKEVPFVLAKNGKEYKPKDLFDGDDNTLRKLFPYEDKFPSKEFCTSEQISFLRKLDIRTKESLTVKDVRDSALYLHRHSAIQSVKINKEQSNAIMSVLQNKIYLLEQVDYESEMTLFSALNDLEILSAKNQPSEFPNMLSWYGESNKLYKPSQMYEARFYKLIGSVSPLYPDDISEVCVQSFKIGRPPVSLVLQQLDLIVQTYKSKYKPELLPIIKDIYTYLTENSDSVCDELQNKKCVWTGDGFCFPNMVYITKGKSDIALEPYLYSLSSDFQNIKNIEVLFRKIGSKECQNWEALRNVQEMILKKHTEASTQEIIEANHDHQLIISILNHMKGLLTTLDIHDEKVLVPIHTDDNKLVLKRVKDCRYSNADWLKDISMEEEEEIFFIHPDVSCETAILLGVPSLTDDLLSDAEGFEEWGQKEPLTRRIKNILKDYTDGFSVPKEIVQNADDAGATKVCFIYDERENEDARVRLLDENMSSCQGPALWAYNNALFTKDDLENITKLSGATKEDDLNKIGKFGLGFCCVYNLTDVPSFITGDQIVIFDPHAKYLGKAVSMSNPGLKINLNSLRNQSMMKRLKNQFKPFNGIFGCDLTMQDGIKPFDGSLFRFPLRTQRQALESDICSKPYPKQEMKKLLNLFMESAGNILLFTQNVSEIELHHISDSAMSPDESVLIYRVNRSIHGILKSDCSSLLQSNTLSNISVVKDLSVSIEKAKKSQQKNFEKVSLCVQVDIQIEVKKEARKLGKKPKNEKTSWLVSWASGTDASKDLVFQPEMKKALPLASVASLIVKNAKEFKLKPIQESPYGFYKESHYFCFLPLPVQCPLPVHINGSFAVTANRRQLSCKTTDDKVSFESRWNEALMGDAVCNAYILLLESLQNLDYKSDDIYSEIWPVLDDAEYKGNLKVLQDVFYQKVVKENPVIFRNGYIKESFNKCIFLEPSLMNSGVGRELFLAAVYFKDEDRNIRVMQMHANVKHCFHKAGCKEDLNEKLLTFNIFYKDVFFPNITSMYWDDKTEIRNSLVHFALTQKTTSIDNQIKTIPCVPSEPHGRLRKPEELVHPKEYIVDLFSEEEEWFISTKACKGKFHDERVLEKLIALGLITDHLPKDVVINRVQSVEILAKRCSYCGLQRFKSVFIYLTKHFQFEDSDSILPEIQNIKFLPVKWKPETWEFSWGGDIVYQNTMETSCYCDKHNARDTTNPFIYERPIALYREKALNLVCCQEYILEEAEITDTNRLLVNLGVKGEDEKEILPETVANNLVCLCKMDTTKLSTEALEMLSQICSDVYKYFDSKLSGSEDNTSDANLVETLNGFKEYPVILLNGQFLYPERVAFYLDIDCSPCLYGINNASLCRRNNFLKALSVKERFEFHDLHRIILQEQKSLINVKLTIGQLGLCCKLLNVLSDSMKCESITADNLKAICGNKILVPDENCMLKPIDDLCMDDSKYIRRSKTMTFVNEKISLEIARRLGIKSKKRKQLKDHSRRLPFGQKEELTTRLKRLLSGYPCDEGVFKELIQNADDAGAKEIHIIKDFKFHSFKHVFDKNWEPLQGPALLVYNDSAFSEADIEGIQKLGIGSKSDDPTKTGQFGVGFNAVYHLTDAPSFLTKGPEVMSGETLCVLDPHRRYVEEEEDESPGMQYIELDDIKATYPDVFDCYYEKQLLKDKGTVFRFPLRSDMMAKTSSIKDDPITPDQVNKLLNQFQKEMIKMLLFVKHVEKITISDITTGKLSEEYTVEVCISDEDKEKRKKFMDNVKEVSRKLQLTRELKGVDVTDVNYTVGVKDNNGLSHSWLVIQQLGLKETGDAICESVLKTYSDGKNGMLPIGGVAVPLEYSDKPQTMPVFCFLPLPCLTGLPVIINGHFDLDHETRRSLWKSDKTDNRILWNETLIKHVISPAYVSAVQLFKAQLSLGDENIESTYLERKIRQYHSIFPDFKSASEKYWEVLASSFYKQVVRNENDIFVSYYRIPTEDFYKISFYPLFKEGCTFVSLFDNLLNELAVKNSPFCQPSEKDVNRSEILKQICKILGLKLLDSPFFIYENLKRANVVRAAVLTPDHLIEFLKSFSNDKIPDRCILDGLNKTVTQTTFLDKTNVIECLQYCKNSKSFIDKIEGLPLCLTNDDVLHKFSKENPVFCTVYCNLFKNSSRLFLSSQMVNFFGCQFAGLKFHERKSLFDRRIFIPFDMYGFDKCLSETLESGKYRQNEPVQWDRDTGPTRFWMKRIWELIYEIFMHQGIKEKEDCIVQLLDPLKHWCILPCHKSEFMERVLLPISDHAMVIFMSSFSPNMIDSLKPLNLPEISSDSIDERAYDLITTHLVARQNKPLAVLNCLYLHRENMNYLKEFQSNVILEYMTENLPEIKIQNSEDAKRKLNYLPVHITIHGTPTNLVHKQKVLLLPQGLPLHGMEIWGEKARTLLLKSNERLKPLYDFLQFSESNHFDVYTKHIFKMFDFLSDSDQIVHLSYIKDHLLNQEQNTEMIEGLKLLPFIRTDQGQVTASQFYSPFNEVFAVMKSRLLKFPPKPFCDREWEHFMEQAGIITTVTEDMFLSFILEVEKEGINSKNVEHKSRTLAHHLFNMNLNNEILQKIAEVKFIVPQQVSDFFIAIHTQCNINDLICFSGSVVHTHNKLVWTNCILLPEWAETAASMADLNVCNSPSLEKVVQHIQNVCDSLKNHLDRNENEWENNKDKIHELMSFFYKYLQTEALKDENNKQLIKQGLESKPLVYMPEYNRMLKCSSVVKELDNMDIIRQFQYPLCPLPDDFVPYFKLFEFLGTNKRKASDNYARVLENMSVALGGNEMHINELIIVKKVIQELFRLISFQGQDVDLKVKVLYLPSKKRILVDSTKLIYSDYSWFEKHMESTESLEYFIGFNKLKIPSKPGQDYMKLLPESYRPQFLSQLLHFSVDTGSLQYIYGEEEKQLQEFIQTKDFIESILRLVYHENNRNDQIKRPKLEINESKIISQLQSITVRQVLPFERKWTFKEEVIRTEQIPCFFEERGGGEEKRWLFYFSVDTKDWIQKIDHNFTTMLNKCIGCLLGESTAYLYKILSNMSTPKNLKTLLDGLEITEYSMNELPTSTLFPPAGTIIHPRWHFLLDNNFTEFEVGEYVALQLADDEMPNENETGQVFMFAIVKGRRSDSGFRSPMISSVFQMYLLEIEIGEQREFPAYKIYKLNRRLDSECKEIVPVGHSSGQEYDSRSLEDVFKNIRQILKSIWNKPDIEKKFIIKRLLRQWHPDKNYGNETFATKVFQYIQTCVQKLENNENIDDDSRSSHSTREWKSNTTYESWFNDVHRTCKRDKNNREKAQQGSSSGSYSYTGSHSFSSGTEETPLPQEAKRWYKQALNDLCAAKTFNPAAGYIQAYNWICYNCHQAAEKAMKAVIYGKNANRVTKSHNLTAIASGLGPEIQELANSLDSLLGNHLYMRYPDIIEMPKIPSDIFNATVSTKAIQLTQRLCDLVASMFPYLVAR